jgi:nucleoside-diphosphate-sugar epimerase
MRDEAPDPLAEFRAANVDGTVALAEQAAAAGARRLVFVSSVKVHGERTEPGRPFRADQPPAPRDAYGVSKWEAEQALHAVAASTGLEVTVVRPVLVYGPGVGANFRAMLEWLRRGVPLPLGAARENRRSLVASANLADLLVRCLTHPGAVGATFLASDGDDLSTAELLRRSAAALGTRARLIPVPVAALRGAGALLGRADLVRRLCDSLQVDAAPTRAAIEWVPPVSVDAALAATARALAAEATVPGLAPRGRP